MRMNSENRGIFLYSCQNQHHMVLALDLNLRPLTNKLGGRLDYDQPACKSSSDELHLSERCQSGSCKTFAVKMSPLHVGERSQHAHAFTRRSGLRRNL
jgi:hypothetical protein